MQNNIFRLVCFGDIVGSRGVNAFEKEIPNIKRELAADAIIVNGENSYDKDGLDVSSAETLLKYADAVTGGNHTISQNEIHEKLDDDSRLLRPANLPSLCPGRGATVITAGGGVKILVMNISGQVFMPSCDSPFDTADAILKKYNGKYDISVCDIHAEATSEKTALGIYLDGRVSAVFGTHTHIPTADEHILPEGTGYITDVGMCGVYEGTVLGVRAENVISRFRTGIHGRFERVVPGKVTICGVVFDIDIKTGRCTEIKRIKY